MDVEGAVPYENITQKKEATNGRLYIAEKLFFAFFDSVFM